MFVRLFDHPIKPNLLRQKSMRGTFDYPKIRSDAKLGQSSSELGCSGAFVIHFSRYEKNWRIAAVQMLERRSQPVELSILLLRTVHELLPYRTIAGNFSRTLGKKIRLGTHWHHGLNSTAEVGIASPSLQFPDPVRGSQQGCQVPSGRGTDRANFIWVNAEGIRVSPQESDRCLAIMNGRGKSGFTAQSIGDGGGQISTKRERLGDFLVILSTPLGPSSPMYAKDRWQSPP